MEGIFLAYLNNFETCDRARRSLPFVIVVCLCVFSILHVFFVMSFWLASFNIVQQKIRASRLLSLYSLLLYMDDHKKHISPTLAKFFNVPYHTKYSEEEVIVAIWKYIISNNLLIDNKVLLLDKMMMPVFHPVCLGNHEMTEEFVVIIWIVRLHQDHSFISKDIYHRLSDLRRNIATRKIQCLWRLHRSRRSSG